MEIELWQSRLPVPHTHHSPLMLLGVDYKKGDDAGVAGAPARRDKEAEDLKTVFNTVLYALAGLGLVPLVARVEQDAGVVRVRRAGAHRRCHKSVKDRCCCPLVHVLREVAKGPSDWIWPEELWCLKEGLGCPASLKCFA